MAPRKKPRYYIVEADVLPEIFLRVVEAKELLETGEARTVAPSRSTWSCATSRAC